MSIEPADRFEIECVVDFPHPFIDRQSLQFRFAKRFIWTRDRGREDVWIRRRDRVAEEGKSCPGGSLENAIVLTADGMLNETPLRFSDEFVRHKILDIIGDIALLGMPVLGKIAAEKSGHSVHAQLMSKLLKTEGAWEIAEAE